LRLGDTRVADTGLEQLKGLTGLRVLWLDRTRVTDSGIEHLKGLTNLKELLLGNTQVTDAGLEHLKGLTNLKTLGLENTRVTDAGLEQLKGLTSLQELRLSGTQVTDPARKEPQRQSLEISVIGRPTADMQEAARGINELSLYQNRLYIGYGDWSKNTGPTDVIYYDSDTKTFVTEFTVDEEAIVRYRQYGERLFLPGVDSKESWDLGNLYVRNEAGWRKLRSVPRGVHVLDFAVYRERWYAATGSYAWEGGPAVGAVHSSTDDGATWQHEYTTPSMRDAVPRVTSLVPFRGRLFAFAYVMQGSIAKESIPEDYRRGLGKPKNRNGVEFFLAPLSDAFGVSETIVHDGAGWQQIDLVEGANVRSIEPCVYGDQLILSVWRQFFAFTVRDGAALYAYDSEKARRLKLGFSRMVDMLPKEDRFFCLLKRGETYVIAESKDLVTWREYPVPGDIATPLSIEHDGSAFYLGLKDGTVVRAIVSVGEGN